MLRNPNSLSKKDTIIEDPAMEPYFMTRSVTHEFTVFERVTKWANNKKYLRVVGYPSTFGRALNMIVRELQDFQGDKSFGTLKEYFNKWNKITDRIDKALIKDELV